MFETVLCAQAAQIPGMGIGVLAQRELEEVLNHEWHARAPFSVQTTRTANTMRWWLCGATLLTLPLCVHYSRRGHGW